MIGLSDGERISMTCSAVLIQYTRVTDGQTDGIGVAYTRYSIYAVVRNKTDKNDGDDGSYFYLWILSNIPTGSRRRVVPLLLLESSRPSELKRSTAFIKTSASNNAKSLIAYIKRHKFPLSAQTQ